MAIASGAIASGAIASGAIASGHFSLLHSLLDIRYSEVFSSFGQDPLNAYLCGSRGQCCCALVVQTLPNTKTGNRIARQLAGAGTSPAANHGEAQNAESRQDVLHKTRIALKELRETFIWLKTIEPTPLCEPNKMTDIVGECDELIATMQKVSRPHRTEKRIDNPHPTPTSQINKLPMTNDEGSPNDECQMLSHRTTCTGSRHTRFFGFGFRHFLVIGCFVIRH